MYSVPTQSVQSEQGGASPRFPLRRSTSSALAAFVAIAGLVLGGQVGRARAAVPSRPSVAVPAYFWADAQWERMLNGATEVKYVVLNPESGPGSVKYPTFETKVAKARSQGATVLGYVDTAYGTRSAALVQADITSYRSWYGVNAFFFDQTPTACTELPYYDAISTFVRSQPNGLIVHNPGTNPSECFLSAADVVVNFEGAEATYAGWTPAGYTSSYPASRFWHIVYSVDPDHASALLDAAAGRQGGLVYLTEQGMPNPFSVIPTPALWSALTPSVTTRPPAPQAGTGSTVPGRPAAPQSGTETSTTTPSARAPVWAVGATVAAPPPTAVEVASAAAVSSEAVVAQNDAVPVVEVVSPPSTNSVSTTTTTTTTLESTATSTSTTTTPAVPEGPAQLIVSAGPALVSNVAEASQPPVTRGVRINRRPVATVRPRRGAFRIDLVRRVA